MPPFPYKTPPFGPYQRDILARTALLPYHFLAMEQGTGKTWVAINTAAALALHGKITGMVVLAPNGVHRAWAEDQIPTHMPEEIGAECYVWSSGRSRRKRQAFHATNTLGGAPFPVLCMNSEALATVEEARDMVTSWLTARRCLMVVDESGDFATPSARRTRALMKWRTMAPYRRCLDGTPVGGAPWDVYAPCRFLSASILGFPTFQAMKDAHGIWHEHERHDNGRTFKVCVGYTGVEQVAAKLRPHMTRITKAEALPFLPPKLFHTHYFELTDVQRRMTQELKDTLTTTLGDHTISTPHLLTYYLRAQQISCGYVPADIPITADPTTEEAQPQPIAILPGDNPRLSALMEHLSRHRHPTIVWTRFKFDIQLLLPALTEAGWRVGVYDGSTPTATREQVVRDFMSGALDLFLGNPAAGGRGLNLQRATHVVYYANYFGLRMRLQSEDRAHRIGSSEHTSVSYTDIIGAHSIDQRIVKALRSNKNLADQITGDPTLTNWL